MLYIGKICGGFHGLITNELYSISKGKPFEAIEGDVPEEFGTPIQSERKEVMFGEEKVETASLRKPGRPKK